MWDNAAAHRPGAGKWTLNVANANQSMRATKKCSNSIYSNAALHLHEIMHMYLNIQVQLFTPLTHFFFLWLHLCI